MINRNSYRSLLESVQEAVSPATAGSIKGGVRRTRRSPASQSAPAAGQNVQWGDSSIGGAMNAMELAQWLNSQTGGMAAAAPAGVSPSTSPTAKAVRSRTAKPKPSTTAGISEEYDDDFLDQIIDELGEARLVAKIATRKSGKTVPSSKASASTAGGMGRMTTSTRPGTPSSSGPSGEKLSHFLNSQSGAKPVKEDFDIIDEILAEGLDLYGEEELAEILADFEETGELSEELLDLISETDSLWVSRNKAAKKKA